MTEAGAYHLIINRSCTFLGPDAVVDVCPNVVELMLIGTPASMNPLPPTRNVAVLNTSRQSASKLTEARPVLKRFPMRDRFRFVGRALLRKVTG